MAYHPALGVPGDYFYHYTTREAAFEHILPDRTLRLSPVHLMRDPLESNPAFLAASYGITDDPEADYERQAVAMEAGMKLQQLRGSSKALSMTIDADEYQGDAEVFGRGYARARMWEQYAENHAGVCLMLRREAFGARALTQLQARSPDSCAGGVAYTPRGILENPAATLMPNPAAANADEIVAEHVPTALALLHEAARLAKRARVPICRAIHRGRLHVCGRQRYGRRCPARMEVPGMAGARRTRNL